MKTEIENKRILLKTAKKLQLVPNLIVIFLVENYVNDHQFMAESKAHIIFVQKA